MDAFVTTASDVGAEIAATVEVINGLDAVFANCPSLAPATQLQWTAYKQGWNTFIQSVNDTVYTVPLTNLGVSLSWPFAVMTQVQALQGQLLQWQDIARTSCGAAGPVVTPADTSDPAWLTAVKWGGGLFVAGAVIFALAPVFEVAAASKVAGVVGRHAKASAASVRRLAQRART